MLTKSSGFLGVLTLLLAPTGPKTLWRRIWRRFPALNRLFPDLNGVWVGGTNSNWPTIEKLAATGLSGEQTSKKELHDTPGKTDAIAVRITCSLFVFKVESAVTATNGCAYSLTAKPRRDEISDRIHLSYVYQQETPEPAITDEETHLGAAELVLDPDDTNLAKSTYWTRRSWKKGFNTAGIIEIRRKVECSEQGKTLRDYAAEHKAKITDQVELVRVVGLEPTLLAERVFETLASTIPPHPH